MSAQDQVAQLAPLVGLADLEEWAEAIRNSGKSIVFTNGCFDMLHRGHIESLIEASKHGDVLLVAMNSDESVTRIKGPGRPAFDEQSRALMLRALRVVGAVTIFETSSSLPVILLARPDVLAKGGQYSESEIVGGDEVRSWGGRVERLSMVDGVSTTSIVERIRAHKGS